jgi:hypothetical protein
VHPSPHLHPSCFRPGIGFPCSLSHPRRPMPRSPRRPIPQ